MPEQSEDHQYLGDFRSHGEREGLEEAKRQYAKRRAEWRRNASIPDLIRVSIREWLRDSIHYETQEKIKNTIGFIVAIMLILFLMHWMGVTTDDDSGDFCDTHRCSRD